MPFIVVLNRVHTVDPHEQQSDDGWRVLGSSAFRDSREWRWHGRRVRVRRDSGAGAAASVKSPPAVYGQPENFVAERAQGAKVEGRGAAAGDLVSMLRGVFSTESASEHGWSIVGIMDKLKSTEFSSSTEAQVRVAVAELCDDGALYSTVDDDHWASTS